MNRKAKNILIIILFLAVIGMAIGYAALSQLLTINGTANISAKWDIKISNIAEGTLTGATSKTAATVSGDKLSAKFDVNLEKPGATATYIVTVENAGTIDAILENVTGIDAANAANPTDVTFDINANKNDTLTSGATKDYTVTVKWLETAESIPTTKEKTATITLNYVQAP